jgi:hypothetical protein
MRTIKGTFAALLLLAAATALQAQTTTLPAAVEAGRVRITVSGTGSSSGDSIRLIVVKSPDADARELLLTVPPGTKLTSTDTGAQSMVVSRVRGRETGPFTFVPTSTIVAGVHPVTYILEAYCTEFEKDNPSGSTSFRVQASDPELACILQKALGDGLSVEAIQAAVWILTDRLTFEHMVQKFPVSDIDFRRAADVVRYCQARR